FPRRRRQGQAHRGCPAQGGGRGRRRHHPGVLRRWQPHPGEQGPGHVRRRGQVVPGPERRRGGLRLARKTQTSKRVGSAHPFLFATTGHRRGESRQTALRFWSRHPTYSQVGSWGGSLGPRAEVSSSAGDWHVLAPLLETSAL